MNSVCTKSGKEEVTFLFLTLVSLLVDQIRVMLLDSEVKYPLLLSANFLITTNQPLLASSGDNQSCPSITTRTLNDLCSS